MTPESKELLKSIGKLIGLYTSEFADAVTLGIPRGILKLHIEEQAQKERMERQFPYLISLPWKSQSWHELKLGASENTVGMLLGRPRGLDVIDIQKQRENNWEYKFDKMWEYDGGAVYFTNKNRGIVYFKNEIVVAFYYESALNEIVKEGFPIAKQIN